MHWPRYLFRTVPDIQQVAGCMPDRELAALRDGRRQDQRSQSLSVKALIKSIEEQRKSGCSSMHSSHTGSRRNSTDTETSFIAYQVCREKYFAVLILK